MRRVFLFVLFVALFASVAYAETARVEVTDCRLIDNDGQLVCSEEITATCDTEIIGLEPEVVMSNVQFKIGGDWYYGTCDECPANGSQTGEWNVTISIDADLGNDTLSTVRLDAVRTQLSSDEGPNEVCLFEKDIADQNTGCFGTFGTPRELDNQCACTYETISSVKSVDNTITYTRASTCTDDVSVSTEFYDYCDPEWTAQYSACTNGTAEKTYYANNPSCCAATASGAGYVWYNHNTGSDCVEPIDHGTTVACELAEVVEPDIQNTGSGVFEYADTFAVDQFVTFSTTEDMEYQPLVYDIDGDGRVEIITVGYVSAGNDSGTYVHVYNQYLSQEQSFELPGVGTEVTGQYAFQGVYDEGSGILENSSTFINGNPVLLVPVQTAAGGELHVIEFSAGGAPSLLETESLAGDNPYGIRCEKVTAACNFITDEGQWNQYTAANQLVAFTNLNGKYDSGFWNTSVNSSYYAYNGSRATVIYNDNGEALLAWPMYRDLTGSPGRNGRIVVTDVYGNIHGTMETESQIIGVPPWYQTAFDLRLPLVYKDGNVYVTAKERAAEADPTPEEITILSIYVMDIGSMGTGTAFQEKQVDPDPLWAGYGDGSEDDVTNPVVAFNSVATVYSSSSASLLTELSESATLVSEPTLEETSDFPLTDISAGWVVGSDGFEYLLAKQFILDGDIFDVDDFTTLYDFATGAVIDRVDNPPGFYGTQWSIPEFHEETFQFCQGNYNPNGGSPFTQMSCYDYSSGSIADDGQTSVSGAQNEDVHAILGDYVLWGTLPYRSDLADVTSKTAFIGSGDMGSATSTPQSYPIAYNPSRDILVTQQRVIVGYADGFGGTGGDIYTLPDGISGAAFNFDWENPAYFDSDGYRHTILSWDPFQSVKDFTQCGDDDFTPVFYNADDHILGIITVTSDDSGPQWGYCDFSDDDNPVVVAYSGLEGPAFSSYTNSSGTYTWTVNRWSVTQTTDQYDDSGEWEFTELGRLDVNSSDIYARGWSIDDVRYETEVTRGPQTDAVYVNENGIVTRRLIADWHLPSRLFAADVVGNGIDDLIETQGFWRTTSYRFEEFNGGDEFDSLMPVDLDADDQLDFIGSRPFDNQLRTYLGTANVVATTQGDVAVQALRCSNLVDGRVQVQVAASVPNPDDVIIGIDAGDGSGVYYPVPRSDGTYVYTYTQSGDYTITATVQDGITYESDSQTCSVEVDVTQEVTSCSLGYGSEFEYSDPITDHGWTVLEGIDRAPANGLLLSGPGDRYAYDVTNCRYETVTMTTELYPGAAFLQMNGQDSANVIGFTTTNTGQVKSLGGTIIATVEPDELMTARIVFSYAQQRMSLYINGNLVTSRAELFEPKQVRIGGDADWEYVRLAATGSRYQQVATPEDMVPEGLDEESNWEVLAQCDSVALANETEISTRLAYPRVGAYCGSLDGGCGLTDLRAVINYNNGCMKEAYNYCVTEVIGGDDATTSLQGGTTCSSLLLFNGFADQIVLPTAQGFFDVVTEPRNLVPTLVIILVLIMVVVPLMARRR